MLLENRPWNRPIPPYIPLPGLYAPPAFETLIDVYERRRVLLNRLADYASDSQLIAKMHRCTSNDPCGSAACPICNRKFRLRLYQQVLAVMPPESEIMMVSQIPRQCRIEEGYLGAFDLARWVKSRQRGFARALPDEALFVGGTDISFNTTDNRDGHWCFHNYGFVFVPLGWGVANQGHRTGLRKMIECHNPGIANENNGVRFRPLRVATRSREQLEETLLYAHKAEFYRRSRYFETKRTTGRLSTNVIPYALRPRQHVEVALFLDRFPIGTRLILKGLRRRGEFADFKLWLEADCQSSREGGL